MSSKAEWYLKKKNNTQYGPVSLDELALWAKQCRIIAGNQASQDQKHWIPVEDIPALQMDWFAQRQDGKQYGPFPLDAIPALVEHNVLPDDAMLTHRATRKTMSMQEALETRIVSDPKDKPEKSAQTPEQPPNKADTPVEHKTTSASVTDKSPATKHEETESLRQEIKDLKKQLRQLLQAEQKKQEAFEDQAQQTEAELDALRKEIMSLNAHALTQQEQAQEKQQQLIEKINELEDALAKEQAFSQQTRAHDSQHEDIIVELRQQVAFMKKNIAALNSELSSARATSAQRAKLLAGAWVAVTLATTALILSLLGRGCSPPPSPVRDGITAPATESDALPPIADRRTDNGPRQQTDTTAPVPEITIEGIRIVSRNHDGVSLRFEEGIFSSLDTLSTEGRQLLDALARQLPRDLAGWQLVIEGHTDDIPLRSTTRFANNEALGLARAEAVQRHLNQRARFPSEAITARAGTTAPYPNDSSENRVRNRTVTIQLKRR